MKKNIFLFIAVVFISFTSTAQFEVASISDGAVITDGDVLNFGVSGCAASDPCKWNFSLTNTSSNDIYIKIFVDNMVNSNGQNVQLCFAGTCLNSISLNSGYPANAVLVPAGVAFNFGNYFWNQNPAGSPAMAWTLRFQAFSDASAATVTGSSMSVTYNYNQTFTSETITEDDINVFYNRNSDQLVFETPQAVTVRVFDLQGRLIVNETLDSGQKFINGASLNAQVYIINIETETSQVFTRKIMVSK